MKRRKKKSHPSIPFWMTTFTDMTTLLLTFFILMFTTAEIDGHKLRLILSSFSGSFGIMKGGMTLVEGPLAEMGFTVEKLPSSEVDSKLMSAKNIAENFFKVKLQQGYLKISEIKKGLLISLPGQIFFRANEVEITKEGLNVLNQIAEFLISLKLQQGMDRKIIIQGYASKEPDLYSSKDGISSFSKLWEYNMRLSSGRAENVLSFLVKEFIKFDISPHIYTNGRIPESRFSMEAYGEFQPLESNAFGDTRIWNRRVDILILRQAL